MAKKQKKIEPANVKKPKRTHRQTITFNDTEINFISNFCSKYRITKKTKFFRETTISTMLQRLENDHPKLF